MASILSWLLTYLQIPQNLAQWVAGLTRDPLAVLFLLAALALVCGLFIDTLPALIILTPVLAPIATQFCIDPLQFAIMLILNLAIGMITPPANPRRAR